MFHRFFTFLFFIFGLYAGASGQLPTDAAALSARDSVSLRSSSDSASSMGSKISVFDRFRPRPDKLLVYGSPVGGYIISHPFFPLDKTIRSWLISRRSPVSTDWIFYLFVTCLFYIGLMRLVFPRYMGDLWLVFGNVVHRQQQLRDQVAQYALPSFLLNIFFCLSGGIFLFFLWRPDLSRPHWFPFRSILTLVFMLMVIYLVKHLILMLAGWLASHQRQAASYGFIVMMVNKVAGILLLPVSLLLAYRGHTDRHLLTGFALLLVGVLFLVRISRTYDYLSKELKITLLNFILLVISFEVLPILLLGKAFVDHFL